MNLKGNTAPLARRHLTAGQRAMIALDLERIYADEAKERQREYHGNQHDRGLEVNSPQVQQAQPEPKQRDPQSRDKAAVTSTLASHKNKSTLTIAGVLFAVISSVA